MIRSVDRCRAAVRDAYAKVLNPTGANEVSSPRLRGVAT